MKRTIISTLCAAALLLTACANAGGSVASASGAPPPSATIPDGERTLADTAAAITTALAGAPPATLSRTTIDDHAINLAFWTFDAALSVVDALVATHVIVPGSPRALALRGYVLDAQRWLNAASAAQRAGNATDYRTAFESAATAIHLAQQALNGGPS